MASEEDLALVRPSIYQSLLRSGRLLSVANQSSLPYSESYLREK